MRSPQEIRFRLRQESANFRYAVLPPRLSVDPPGRFPALPDPVEVARSLAAAPFAADCLRIANEILAHRFPLLGTTLDTGPEIRWRRDYASGIETPPLYFRRVPYLDVTRAGDHKNIWELNRHQHLVLLAQAYLFSGRDEFVTEIVRELNSWFEQNPFQRGINWASALEVAFRALSWIWIWHFVSDRFDPPFCRQFFEGLYHHGLHLEVNLSYYFSPNTHLLGEAVALHALGTLFPQFPTAARWRETGARVVRAELDNQVLADGCHFERSTYYHVYALDMFLFHAILRGRSAGNNGDPALDDVYREKLARMARFLDAVLGPSGILPFIGDDDGGRFFHPYGPRSRFGLATLATCGIVRDPSALAEQAVWWLKSPPLALVQSAPRESVCFPDSGLVIMTAGKLQLIVDAGPFGPGSAGHSHADTLSVVLRRGNEQILIDPGTYTYVGDPAWRDRFRGTAAHNTIRIDGMDQAVPRGPFGWQTRPKVELLKWETSAAQDTLIAACSYAGFRHQRKVVLRKMEQQVLITDDIEGPPGKHRLEQFWHFGETVRDPQSLVTIDPADQSRLDEGGDYGWISPALAAKTPAPVLSVTRQTTLPASFTTRIDLGLMR